jgi:aryl-alcohol dehydrogenase-like predicted oxidoreductase
MLYREFGKLGWPVSAVAMGTWNIGNQWGELDDATSWATVNQAIESGINLFDTADSYGLPHGFSEQRLGAALAGRRHQVYIVSKCGFFGTRSGSRVPTDTVDTVRQCAHASLGRMKTDWMDVLLCHKANMDDYSVFLEGFESLKADGDIRGYGVSTNDLEALKRFNVNGTCDVVEVHYNLLDRDAEAEFLPYCKENNIAVLVRGPLAMGLLSGKYDADTKFTDSIRGKWHDKPAQQEKFLQQIGQVDKLKQEVKPGAPMVKAALQYVISDPAQPIAIPGAKSPEQAASNAAAGEALMDADRRQKLAQLVG